MTCRETIRLICEYLDGRLSPGVTLELREHMAFCGGCRSVLDAARRTLQIHSGPAEEAPLPREAKAKPARTAWRTRKFFSKYRAAS